MTADQILQEIKGAIAAPENKYISDAVSSGKKVIGYYCTYIPEEIFTAAGVVPYRIRGLKGLDTLDADAYLSARICTFVRSSLAVALGGGYDFLDGVVLTQACDHVRRGADIWRKKVKRPFYSFLSIPRTQKEWVLEWYKGELSRLKAELEEHLGVAITPEKLTEAIKLHNEIRQRLKLLSGLRAGEKPPLSGEDALSITIASAVMPKEEFLKRIDSLISLLSDRELDRDVRARLILTGGEFDEPDYLATIEDMGGLIVGEELCYGGRLFSEEVDEEKDPLDALARRYFFKIGCARMVGGFPGRLDSIIKMVAERNADGVVFQRIKFCDPWASDAHNLKYRLKGAGIPALFLEREYGVLARGQVRTRVQGFLESIGK
jgi:benzoyl-CoA reductase/2-hydroxyglutaryl-CoA dehydratase subunit BcrC/BadD/HgdB